MDTVMITLFVLFMVWIIRGYHANKYEERYGEGGTERRDTPEEERE